MDNNDDRPTFENKTPWVHDYQDDQDPKKNNRTFFIKHVDQEEKLYEETVEKHCRDAVEEIIAEFTRNLNGDPRRINNRLNHEKVLKNRIKNAIK